MEETVCFFTVAELCPKSILLKREQYWIDKCGAFGKSGYNMQPNAHSSIGIKRSPEFREACRQRWLGHVKSPETILKLKESLRMVDRSGFTRHKIRVNQIKDGVVINSFDSIVEAGHNTGIDHSTIGKVCRKYGINKTAGGFGWEYADAQASKQV